VARYDVYVSINGGGFALWLAGTSATSAVFPGEPGSTYAFYTIATDSAGNREPQPNSGVGVPFFINHNQAPVIDPIADYTIGEGEGVAFEVKASDSDGSSTGLRYRVVSSEPGIVIDFRTGWLRWFSREGDGGRSIPVAVQVSDSGRPVATVTRNFTIHVRDVNHAPAIDDIPFRNLELNRPFTTLISAADPDVPAQALRFSLAAGSPVGMAIDANTGVLSWTPGEEFAGRNLSVTIEVTDNGEPALTARRTFGLHVLDTRPLPTLAAVDVPVGERQPGLTYAYYQGAWSELPDLGSGLPLVPYKMGIAAQPNLSLRERANAHAFIFAGYLQVPETGFYTFFASALSDLRIWIGDELLLDLDGVNSPAEGFAPIGLEAGLHPLRIEYLKTSAPGLGVLALEWEGPDLPRAIIPNSAYLTTFETLRDPNAPLDSDLDGIPDSSEALFSYSFGTPFNPLLPDSNGNGVIDGLEDADSDGIPNAFEIRYGTDPFQADGNANGIPDGQEDVERDGLTFVQEVAAGTNPFLSDTDSDGWNDETEVSGGADPLSPTSRPLGLIYATPALQALRLSAGTAMGRGAVRSSPVVSTLRLGEGAVSGTRVIATPAIQVARLGSALGGAFDPLVVGGASVIATPSVRVVRLGSAPGEAVGANVVGGASIIATPPVLTVPSP
jgi:hypothetical protein